MSSSVDQVIIIWDIDKGVLVSTLAGHTNSVNSLISFSYENENYISSSSDNNIFIWKYLFSNTSCVFDYEITKENLKCQFGYSSNENNIDLNGKNIKSI